MVRAHPGKWIRAAPVPGVLVPVGRAAVLLAELGG